MRGKSHRYLGQYLAQRYMSHLPRHYIKAFLVGCVEPDKNPLTYLKGSIRYQWMRGHNYPNAHGFIRSISRRLEAKNHLNLYDYYTLGKLIHYIADAFTYAHNEGFLSDLEAHRAYEAALEAHFLSVLHSYDVNPSLAQSVMEAVYSFRQEYEDFHGDIPVDTRFVLNASCTVLSMLPV